MAAKSAKDTAPAAEAVKKTAEEWAIEKQIPGVYLAGVKQRMKWAKNKMLEEREFDAALRAFLTAAADGRSK